MVRRSKEIFKWSVIAIATILTLTGILTEEFVCMVGIIPLFWFYVFLDKIKNE